jgi:hypothetical protein
MSVVNPGHRRDNGLMEHRPWQMWLDFGRVYSGLTYGHVDDAAPGTEIRAGRYVIVGDDDADPAVAQVVEVKDDGTVLLRVLPGHADLHATLVSPQPA